MSETPRAPIAVSNFKQTGNELTSLDNRVANIEAVSIPAQKVWRWGKIFAPIGLGLIIASAGATSPLGKAAQAVKDTMTIAAGQ